MKLFMVMVFNATLSNITAGRRGRDCMVVELTTTYAKLVPSITNVVSSNPVHGEVYSVQHIKVPGENHRPVASH
jgi:hypothetical protein